MIDFKWSDSEKKIARRAFDAAVQRELAALLKEMKDRAAKAERTEDIWALYDYLSEQRRSIDGKYDYRYSQLTFVFGRLLREGWIEEQDIDGLAEEKLERIRLIATL
ncbi:MAG: hypothetical protein HGA78_04245 [Nitrospirales bacterium]|nr:hypothetical protein [Nitrospirales bacterium]